MSVAIAVAAGSAIIGGGMAYLGSKEQAGAAEAAAETQAGAAVYATDAQVKMWEQAQADWEPYLDAGYQGITSLQTQMPKYMQDTVMPAYNNYMQGLGAAQYDPRAFTVDPVTGQIGGDYTAGDANSLYGISKGSYSVPNTFTKQGTQNRISTPQTQASAPVVSRPTPIGQPSAGTGVSAVARPLVSSNQISSRAPTTLREDSTARTANNMQMQNVLASAATPQALNLNAMSGANYTPTQNSSLTQGGVLSPLTPTLEGKVDFQWNQDDPIYQFKLQQAQDAARKSLAKQGLLDSRAGVNTLSDTALRVGAEDIDKQYSRQVAERDYLTQKAMSEYQMQAQRGDTLYGRLTGQQSALYSGLHGNQDTSLSRLAATYGLGNSLYGQVYGQQLDLAKIGTGAAGSAGSNSMALGQQIGSNALYAGNAQAQAQLQAGQAQAGMYNNFGNTAMNAASLYSMYGNNGGNSFYGGSNYGGSNPLSQGSGISWDFGSDGGYG